MFEDNFSASLNLAGLKVWVLSDGKAGHENQSLGVARALGFEPVLIRLKKRRFGKFFGFLGPDWLVENAPTGPWPDMVIATGNLTVPIVRHIKHHSPATFTVQMMTPTGPKAYFDVIAAPAHDKAPHLERVTTTVGAPNLITPEGLEAMGSKWAGILKTCRTRKVWAVLVGGDAKKYRFTPARAAALAVSLKALAEKEGITFLVTTSRRTSIEAEQTLKTALGDDAALFWSPRHPVGENPYQGLLALAKGIVVTVDSISMVSEACSTGKPVYVFDMQQAAKMGKFKRFFATLQSRGMVQPLEAAPTTFSGQPLADAAHVAGFVRARYLRRGGGF